MPTTEKPKPTVTQMVHDYGAAYDNGQADYLILKVEGNATEPEVIINPKANIKEKLEYYQNAYNDDFTLKAKPEIHVTDYMFCTEAQLIKAFKFL